MLKQRAPGFGQVELLVDSQKKRYPNLFFELAHVNADRGLCQMYARRCMGEGAGFGNCFEGSQEPKFHDDH